MLQGLVSRERTDLRGGGTYSNAKAKGGAGSPGVLFFISGFSHSTGPLTLCWGFPRLSVALGVQSAPRRTGLALDRGDFQDDGGCDARH